MRKTANRKSLWAFTSFLAGATLLVSPTASDALVAENAPKAFAPTPVEEARLLLRKVEKLGHVSYELASLDTEFESRVGQTCTIARDKLRAYLGKNYISEWEIGGSIDAPLSMHANGDGTSEQAKYFVIHDTSYPRYGSNSFPSNINDESWDWNELRRWNANVTHIYVNRIGQSKTMTPFSDPMTATKLERFVLGEGNTRGLYLHIELIQPRCYISGYGKHNDVGSPTPGFTYNQYKRLALLYCAASIRKGEWLIPAFHACVDNGIRNAHDDPQGFELWTFFSALNEVRNDIEKTEPAAARTTNGNE